jgi:hypothetical protein
MTMPTEAAVPPAMMATPPSTPDSASFGSKRFSSSYHIRGGQTDTRFFFEDKHEKSNWSQASWFFLHDLCA